MEANLIDENQFASPIIDMVASITGTRKRSRDEDVDFESNSPWIRRRIKSDLLDARSQIVSLETQINKMHTLRKEQEILFNMEKERLTSNEDRHKKTINDLEKRISDLKRREYDSTDEHQINLKKIEVQKNNLEKKNLELQNERILIEDKYLELLNKCKKETLSKDMKITKMESELNIKSDDIIRLNNIVTSHEMKISELNKKSKDLDETEQKLQNAFLKIKELENIKESYKETIQIAKTQQQKLLNYPKLEKEISLLKEDNNRLKEAVYNTSLLQEKLKELENCQEIWEEKEKEWAKMAAKLKYLESSLEEWKSIMPDENTENVKPHQIREKIKHLQNQELILTNEVAQNEMKVKSQLQIISKHSLDIESLKRDIHRQSLSLEEQMNLVKRLQKKVLLVTRERDSYRSQLDCYEKELTVTNCPRPQEEISRNHGLEKALEGYRDMVKKLESDLVQGGKTNGFSIENLEKFHNLENERDSLKKENENLKKRTEQLELEFEHRALKGDFNLQNTKVLHFRINPTSQAISDHEYIVENLQKECAKLRERVRLLEQGQSCDITQLVDQKINENHTKEIQDLKEQVKSYDIKMQRLKEAFKKTSQDFRESCYSLLGYKVDRNESHYKLSSLYADSPDDYFMFQFQPSGEINLLQTSFSNRMEHLMKVHLQQNQSIPMFLSSVTQELFAGQSINLTQSIIISN